MYCEEFGRNVDPFKSIISDQTRKPRNATRKILQNIPEKRKKLQAQINWENGPNQLRLPLALTPKK